MDKDKDLEKIKRYEDSSHKVLLLEKYIDEQQAIIQQLEKDKAILKERLRECGMRLDRFNCR